MRKEPKVKESIEGKEETLDEIAHLTKNIAVHEAKSMVCKVKLAKLVLEKGGKAAYKGVKVVSSKVGKFVKESRS